MFGTYKVCRVTGIPPIRKFAGLCNLLYASTTNEPILAICRPSGISSLARVNNLFYICLLEYVKIFKIL